MLDYCLKYIVTFEKCSVFNLNSTMIVPDKMLCLLLLASSFNFGHALDCTTCQSETSWEGCQKVASVATCSTDEVNEFHALASIGNPTLIQGSPEDGLQCFALHVRSKDSASASPDRFSKGCTFGKTQFCSGWISSLEVVECGVNAEGDVTFSGVGRFDAMRWSVVIIGVGLFLRMI